MELSDRKKNILRQVVETYVSTGEPVGSKLLCGRLNVSSATVRNEMSDLSDMGLLEQMHTSSGRVPSQAGYRYYVDNLMTRLSVPSTDKFAVQSALHVSSAEPDDLLKNAVSLLARLTGCAAMATTPYDPNAVIRRVELVPMGQKTAMAVVMSSTGVVKSRLVRLETPVNVTTADVFYGVMANGFIGRRIGDVSIGALQSIMSSLGDSMMELMPLVFCVTDLAREASVASLVSDGQSNLLRFPELENDRYELFDFFRNAQKAAGVVGSMAATGVTIGRENAVRALRHCAVVGGSYSVGSSPVGAVAVIGPVRLDYCGIIPVVNYVCEVVGEILSDGFAESEGE